MFRVHNETIPKSFQTKFQYIEHKYETRQSKDNFIIPKRNTRITSRIYPLFKSTIKENLRKLKTETNCF